MELLGSKLSSTGRGVVAAKAAVIPGGGETLSYPGDVAVSEALIGGESVGIQLQPDAVAFGALAADTAPISTSFPIEDDEFDLDRPTAGFASIPEAIEDIRQGKVGMLSVLHYRAHFNCSSINVYVMVGIDSRL